jgi:putative membrane protein insertion efficiency factor
MKKQIREVRIIDLITYAILPLVIVPLVWTVGLKLIDALSSVKPWIIYTVYGVVTYILVKRFFIGLVLLYKIFAPIEMRDSCRFYPTCSTYMIMAIKKYGLVYGIYKGIRRLLRCKPPNGGVDYP